MTGQPYTDADVRLIAGELRETGMKDAFFDDSSGSWEVEEKQHQYESAARVVLDALAAAGRLLPTGTGTVEQFAARVMINGEPVEAIPEPTTRERAEARVRAHDRERADNPQWRGSAELVQRHQHTTPWQSAPVSQSSRDHDAILEALGNVRFQFWACPVREHAERNFGKDELVVTVEWRGDIAYCTAPDCRRNSQQTTEEKR